MKQAVLWSGWIVALLSVLLAPIAYANSPRRGRELSELSVSEGHWVYHGRFIPGVSSQRGKWVWNENCHWAENSEFMLCSFSNDWNGKHVSSIVVDTYNAEERSFWHFEVFNTGPSAQKPFAAKMIIRGNRRIESWVVNSKDGNSKRERIVYVFSGTNRVKVLFQTLGANNAWLTTARGFGKKT
jgi:hypothetical protein